MAGIEWLFEIDATPATYFGTKSTTFDAKTYYGLVNPSFRGLPTIRIKAETSSYTKSKFSFEVLDDASTFAASDFEGKEVIVRMVSSSVELESWRFVIETAQESYRSWKINCKDFLSTVMDGVWPNTGLVKDIFPERYVKSDGELQVNEKSCLPVSFGTTYIPLSSIFDTPDVKFVLGSGDVLEGVGDCTTNWADNLGTGVTYDATNDEYDWSGAQTSTSYVFLNDLTLYQCTITVTYTVSFEVKNWSSGSCRIILGGAGYGTWRSSNGVYTEDITCTGVNGRVILSGNSAFNGSMTNIYVNPKYTITELTTPRDQDGPTTYSSGVTYTQDIVNGATVFIPTLDAGSIDMWWRAGQRRLAPVVKFSRTDTASLTNIIDVIEYILKDFGAVDADFDSTSWTAAAATITSRGLTFNRGYYNQQSRSSILCNLLNIAGATLVIGETIEIYLNSKSSVATINTNDILKNVQNGPGSFRYTKNPINLNNSGTIVFSTTGKPEDDLVTAVVPALGSTSDPVSKTLSVVGINDTQDAQRVGIFHYQKLLNSLGRVTFTTPYSASLRVGKIITVYDSGGVYGESKTVEIDSLMYNKNTTIDVEGIVRDSAYVQDWGDITPSSISVGDTPTANEITVLSKATELANTYTDTYAVLVADAGTLAYSDFIDGNTLSVTAAYSTSGLYMNKDYIGFWDQPAGVFANYMSLNGDFRAGGAASNYMFFDESAGTLNINGSISVQNPGDVRTDLNVADGSTAGADWDTNVTNKPQTYRVISTGGNSTSQPASARLAEEDGTVLDFGATSYNVSVYDRTTGTWDSHTTYNVYTSASNAATMAAALNALGSGKIVVIFTSIEPQANRLTNNLDDAIYRCGGSTSIYGSTNFKLRGAYILIGIPGLGQGNGLEMYSGDTDNDTDAWVDTSFTITNGIVQMGGISVRDAVDLLYSDGNSVNSLQPDEAGANVTGSHTANNAANYTGSTIGTSYTAAKCTDPLADQTSTHQSASTAAVGSYSWTVYNNWVTNGTQINGTSIATDTIYLNRLYALTGSVSFVGCQMTFQNGSDLELQSTADSTAALSFTRGSYEWNTYLTASGSNFVIGPTSYGTTRFSVGNSYLEYADLYSTVSSSMQAGASNVNHAHIYCYNSSPRVVIGVGPVSAKYYTFSITALYTSSSMALGESGNRWSNTYTTLLNVSSTATMAAINATGNVAPSANNTYTCGTASYKWSQLHTYLFYCSYITPLVDSTYNCGHTSYGWAQVYTDNMRIGDSVFDGIAPFAANNCLIGNSTYYFGAMYAYKYWSKVADGTFDSLDDLQILDDMGPIKDKDGKYIPHGRGFKGPRQRDMHPAITNFDDLPKMFKEEYRIDITKEELHAILHESAEPIDVPNITVTKDYLKNNKDDLKGWLKRRGDTQIGIIDVEEVHEKGEDYIIKNPIIDADFIESQLFNDMGKEAQLYEGAIRQLNKRVKKERIEYQATIEGLIKRINKLEKKAKNN